MANNENINTNTLKLGNKLSLSKNVESNKIKQQIGKGKARTVTVEVKRSRSLLRNISEASPNANMQNMVNNTGEVGNLTAGEKQARLKAIQLAAENKEKYSTGVESSEKTELDTEVNIVEVRQGEEENVEYSTETPPITEHKASEGVSSKAIDIIEDDEESKKNASKKNYKVERKAGAPKVSREEKLAYKYNFTYSNEESDSPLLRRRYKNNKANNTSAQQKEKVIREVEIFEAIAVQNLALKMAERASDVIKELMKLGVMVTINQVIDADTAELVVLSFGHIPKRLVENAGEESFANLLESQDSKEDLISRPPIVTIMGHVDHGKTSLLDALRESDVVLHEAGGITQHIGAYKIKTSSGQEITFLDTPGHAAFSAIRSRGAKCTDIVILVVAADDGIMPQTIEAINHAKAAEVALIVAINKIDKQNANPARIKNDLLIHNIVVEEFGGDVMVVEISAKEKIGLKHLEEIILLQAEMLELKANPSRAAIGTVIESKMDKSKGVVAHLLVQNGKLQVGSMIVAGRSWGKVRKLTDDKGQNIEMALPSTPVEVTGLNNLVHAGERFVVVTDEKAAKEIIVNREHNEREAKNLSSRRLNMQEFFAVSKGEVREFILLIKSDVHGSMEAILGSLLKLGNEEVKVRVVHSGVGGITESDVNLAYTCKALIIGFNVRAEPKALVLAEKLNINIKYYDIIYNLIDDVQAALSGLLKPIIRESFLGNAEIRQIFDITKIGKIGGSYVTKGVIRRGSGVRLIRNNTVIYEGKLKTLKRLKEEVREVKEGYECGIAFESYSDIRVGDILEVFERIEEKREL